jgi:hypothetical protein
MPNTAPNTAAICNFARSGSIIATDFLRALEPRLRAPANHCPRLCNTIRRRTLGPPPARRLGPPERRFLGVVERGLHHLAAFALDTFKRLIRGDLANEQGQCRCAELDSGRGAAASWAFTSASIFRRSATRGATNSLHERRPNSMAKRPGTAGSHFPRRVWRITPW